MTGGLPVDPDSLRDRLLEAVRRGKSMGRLPETPPGEDLLAHLQALSQDTSMDQRLRMATLNLVQDAVDARRGEEAAAAARAQAQAAYRERDAQLHLAMEVAALGTFSWDLDSLRCEADERTRELCGWPGDSPAQFPSLLALVRAVDVVGFDTAVRAALKPDGSGQLHGDYAVRWTDGSECWLALTADVDFAGEPRRGTRMRGVVLDVTERKRAEAALRASDYRFRQFAAASSDVLWIRDSATLQLEFVSASFEQVFGIARGAVEGSGGPPRWASLIVPEDRPAALECLAQACRGEPVVHEFRIMRESDREFRWIRNTDFPLRELDGRVRRVAGIASDVTDSKNLIEHQKILVAELQHRVRNIMAMIRALASRTAQHARDVESYAEVLTGRLMSMARTQALLTRHGRAGVDLRQIVVAELGAQSHSDQYSVRGPPVQLSPKAAEVLTLVIHELTTNAVKYGAFGPAAGAVATQWRILDRGAERWLSFSWSEQSAAGADYSVAHRGFGSELIEKRVPYELHGTGDLQIGPDGVECRLEFPLAAGDSILETTAPAPSHVYGGSVDMRGVRSLMNVRVLVVEDDYYLAADAERALKNAGAKVQGPFPSLPLALSSVRSQRPDCAMLDINLGQGPTYELAAYLQEAKVPFLFLTGYDRDAIPERFRDVPCLHKPLEFAAVVRSLAFLMTSAPEAPGDLSGNAA